MSAPKRMDDKYPLYSPICPSSRAEDRGSVCKNEIQGGRDHIGPKPMVFTQ